MVRRCAGAALGMAVAFAYAINQCLRVTPYLNLGGNSDVSGYENAPGVSLVQFMDGSVYTYTDASAGADNIVAMHALAVAGQGLNSFIDAAVYSLYESKSP